MRRTELGWWESLVVVVVVVVRVQKKKTGTSSGCEVETLYGTRGSRQPRAGTVTRCQVNVLTACSCVVQCCCVWRES